MVQLAQKKSLRKFRENHVRAETAEGKIAEVNRHIACQSLKGRLPLPNDCAGFLARRRRRQQENRGREKRQERTA
jgi:hypothetical protein